MSFGTVPKTGFSVRDILDLPNPTGRCGSGAKETEEDDTEEASAEASGAEKVGFSVRRFCERGCGSYGRWSRGSGNLHFSREETFHLVFISRVVQFLSPESDTPLVPNDQINAKCSLVYLVNLRL